MWMGKVFGFGSGIFVRVLVYVENGVSLGAWAKTGFFLRLCSWSFVHSEICRRYQRRGLASETACAE